ncbi:sulfotransferase family 2 domain-containing protein [Synechococcus sp. UW179A]|uniref:sulfotransferase family 2 domain-containing protein n=1 Tax=Synechococcus sp. UW179A TaxID=2575510 RepID=UPI000E0F737E|nr:sulfotransferase family 2 domain-containing protein [Synechococcus sp. UW179A]
MNQTDPASGQMPGLRIRSTSDWVCVQTHLQAGGTLTPLLPLGNDAAIVWVPKNGCSTIKRVWLQLQGYREQQLVSDPHSSALHHTYWLTPEELKIVAQHRGLIAIWRDPVDRFVSACRSHLVELTRFKIEQKLRTNTENEASYQEALEYHRDLFVRHGVASFADDSDPVYVMNAVALQLRQWIPCHIDWSHHTIPQVAYLGGDPSCYYSLQGMENINELMQHWQTVSGMEIDTTSQHISRDLKDENPWRRLKREHLTHEALRALHQFYAADWAFLELAQTVLSTERSDQRAA